MTPSMKPWRSFTPWATPSTLGMAFNSLRKAYPETPSSAAPATMSPVLLTDPYRSLTIVEPWTSSIAIVSLGRRSVYLEIVGIDEGGVDPARVDAVQISAQVSRLLEEVDVLEEGRPGTGVDGGGGEQDQDRDFKFE